MDGLVFNIQKFCLNDGPGIRTTVFLKGCPLNCIWCHNPESNLCTEELLFDIDKCLACRRCAEVCENKAHVFDGKEHRYLADLCKKCGRCEENCPAEAILSVGKKMQTDEVIAEVLKDKAFYDTSGGGLTISGGEPLLQLDFIYELLKKAKANHIHTCIETSGFCDTENLEKVANYTDIFLYDWKLTDSVSHRRHTGKGNELIEKNLYAIDKKGAKTILRCPIIPGINNNEEHFKKIASLANSLKNILQVDVIPYHSLGNSKHKKLGGNKNPIMFRIPEDKEVTTWICEIQKLTKVTVKKA